MTSAAPKFHEITIGMRLPDHVRTVTQDDITRMGIASLDYNPVHMNPAWARRAKVFGTASTVAHGMMTMSFLVSMITDWIYPVGGRLRSMDTKFTKPVLPGETITSSGTVIELHYMGKEEDFAVIRLTGVNQNGETVAAGTARISIP